MGGGLLEKGVNFREGWLNRAFTVFNIINEKSPVMYKEKRSKAP